MKVVIHFTRSHKRIILHSQSTNGSVIVTGWDLTKAGAIDKRTFRGNNAHTWHSNADAIRGALAAWEDAGRPERFEHTV